MAFYRVVAAKNNQRVELTVKFDSEVLARESLHSQGYSIIEIRETAAPVQSDSVFYFDILLSWQKKSGQIRSDDILKAYKKLVDDLGYEVIRIYTSQDVEENEKMYTTAKTRESYLEFKKRNTEAAPVQKQQQEALPQKSQQTTDSVQNFWYLWREVQKYQAILLSVSQKMEQFVEKYSGNFEPERIEKIRQIIIALRQTKQSTNIDKLRTIGELALLKVGELEMEIATQNHELKKSQFFRETNSLLKDLGSNRRVGSEMETVKKKMKQMFSDIKTSFSQPESEKPTTTPESDGFIYFKNLRELSIYREKLKEVKKELWRNFFGNSPKKDRLLLKKRLLEQNILILESRVEKKYISYTKITKGILYYEDVIAYIIRSFADTLLYVLMLSIIVFSVTTLPGWRLSDFLSPVSFIWSIFVVAALILWRTKGFSSALVGGGIFLFVAFALQVNF